jgi:hypothetical protein
MHYQVINLAQLGQVPEPAPVPAPAQPSDSGPRWVNEKSGDVGTTLAAAGLVAALAIGAVALFR